MWGLCDHRAQEWEMWILEGGGWRVRWADCAAIMAQSRTVVVEVLAQIRDFALDGRILLDQISDALAAI